MVSLNQARKEPGVSMKGGRYPIRNAHDVHNAIKDLHFTPPSGRAAVRRHIEQRARAVGARLPDDWHVNPHEE